jgi:hypothetical protein
VAGRLNEDEGSCWSREESRCMLVLETEASWGAAAWWMWSLRVLGETVGGVLSGLAKWASISAILARRGSRVVSSISLAINWLDSSVSSWRGVEAPLGAPGGCPMQAERWGLIGVELIFINPLLHFLHSTERFPRSFGLFSLRLLLFNL